MWIQGWNSIYPVHHIHALNSIIVIFIDFFFTFQPYEDTHNTLHILHFYHRQKIYRWIENIHFLPLIRPPSTLPRLSFIRVSLFSISAYRLSQTSNFIRRMALIDSDGRNVCVLRRFSSSSFTIQPSKIVLSLRSRSLVNFIDVKRAKHLTSPKKKSSFAVAHKKIWWEFPLGVSTRKKKRVENSFASQYMSHFPERFRKKECLEKQNNKVKVPSPELSCLFLSSSIHSIHDS